jgi:hypothetical protein
MKDYNAIFNEYLRKVADFDVRWRFKATEIRRFVRASLEDERNSTIEDYEETGIVGDFNVFEAIRAFEEFKVGDIVLWNGKEELEVVGLPVFKHKIYYSSGEHSECERETRWDGSNFKNQEILGYLLKDSRGQVFRLQILADLRLKTP